MKLLVAFSSLLLPGLFGLAAIASEDVLIGTGDNFDDLIKGTDLTLAAFTAPWCGHCKAVFTPAQKLKPEYAKAAALLKERNASVKLVDVDATADENKDLASKFGVKGYPSLKMFKGGSATAVEYNGPRDAEGIVAYLERQAGPAAAHLTSAEEVEAFRKKGGPLIIAVAPNVAAAKLVTEVAEALRDDIDFAYVRDGGLVTEVEKAPGAVMIKVGEAPRAYDGKWKAKALQKWVEKHSQPLVIEIDQSPRNRKGVQALFQAKVPRVIAFLDKASDGFSAFYEVLLKRAGEDENYMYGLVDAKANTQAANFFGFSAEDTPALLIQDGDDKFVKKHTKPEDLSTFLEDFQAGKLEKHVKSEDIPEDNSGPVTVVVGKTFEEVVLGDKNVLLEVYAPWCGHCKKLEPEYIKVGEAFKDNDSVVIAKVDGTANDLPSKFSVKGFPTLFWVGKDGTVSTYSGARTEEALVSFVNEHATTKTSEHSEL